MSEKEEEFQGGSHFQQPSLIKQAFRLVIGCDEQLADSGAQEVPSSQSTDAREKVGAGKGTPRVTRVQDLACILVALLGYEPPYDIPEKLMAQYPQGLSEEDCVRAIRQIHPSSFFGSRQLWLQSFLTLDRDNKGFLSRDDFIKAHKELLPGMSLEGGLQAFRRVDQDGNGRISLRDGLVTEELLNTS